MNRSIEIIDLLYTKKLVYNEWTIYFKYHNF